MVERGRATADAPAQGSGHGGLLTAIGPRRWGPNVIGVVSADEIRRRPGDVIRVPVAALLVLLTALDASAFTAQDKRLYNLLIDLPGWLHSGCEWLYTAGTIGTAGVVLVALLLTRRFGLSLRLVSAGITAWLLAAGLRGVVDASAVRTSAGLDRGHAIPQFPVVPLAVATAVLLVATPFLVRPARRLVLLVLSLGAISASVAVVGLPSDIIGSVALGWGVAAVVHLIFGTPAATPSIRQVEDALRDLGVAVNELHLAPNQLWGESRFVATGPHGEPVSVDVLGRDAADARLMAKIGRSLLYRDSGPSLALTRPQQLEHRAYLLLLAARTGVPVSDVVIAGIGGGHEDALLVSRDPGGTAFPHVAAERLTDDALADAWRNLSLLHDARLTHGQLTADNVRLRDDGTTAFVDFAHGSSGAPPERCARDRVEFLASTAVLVGDDRALAAAYHALGRDRLADLLPLLESAALTLAARRAIPDRKKLLARLREQGAALTNEEVPKLTELRRVSWGNVVMAAATFLGVYLILGQFVGIHLWDTLQTAEWEWVLVAALLSPLPQFTGAIALQGSVAVPMPYAPVVGEQFANNFTGLIGGTIATTALVVRFFQKQGQKVAVAASSGVLNSLASGLVQVVLVIVGLIFTSDSFSLSSTGGDKNIGRIIVIAIVVIGVALGIALLIPRLRRAARGMIQPQLHAAKDNLRGILTTPRKAVMLFGGNLASQLIFALVLDASLHAYGASLPLLQIVVINSLASVLGGMAPVPGGMGVIEAGLIGGLTAAGVPQEAAVAATFTHRLFTAYLPPIWGWFALRWLRRNDYV